MFLLLGLTSVFLGKFVLFGHFSFSNGKFIEVDVNDNFLQYSSAIYCCFDTGTWCLLFSCFCFEQQQMNNKRVRVTSQFVIADTQLLSCSNLKLQLAHAVSIKSRRTSFFHSKWKKTGPCCWVYQKNSRICQKILKCVSKTNCFERICSNS